MASVRNQEISLNLREAKLLVRQLKQIFVGIPKTVVVTPVRKSLQALSNQLPYGIKVFDALVDDANPLDVVEPLIQSGKQGLKDIKDTFNAVKSELRSMRGESRLINEERKKIEKERENMKNKQKNSPKTGRQGSGRSSTGSSRVAKTNHPEWYLKDKTMVPNLVGINIATRQNAVLETMIDGISSATAAAGSNLAEPEVYSIPSCAGVELQLVIPKSNTNDWQQGINMLYKNIRAANAGSINYSPAQLSHYVLTIRAIDAGLSTLGRAIKVLNSGTFYDAVSPQSTFAAMGLDYDTFAENAANARELYSRLSAIRYRLMPLNISLLERTRWLFSNIFKDSNDVKSQVYIPMTQAVPYFTSDGKMDYLTIGSFQLDADSTGILWKDFAEQMLVTFNDYQRDSIFQVIAGDILKAYGKDSLNSYPPIVMDTTIEPVYDEHILTQIQNASLSVTGRVSVDWESPANLDEFGEMTITENIVYDPDAPNLPTYLPVFPQQVEIINRWIINPTYNTNEDVTDAGRLLSSTRFMTSRHAINSTAADKVAYVHYDTYGTEIVNCIRVIQAASPETYGYSQYGLIARRIWMFVNLGTNQSGGLYYGTVPMWSWFDYFPFIVPKFTNTPTKEIMIMVPMFDFNNFGIAYKSSLDSYNAICTLSMLHKPFVSRVNKVEVFEV